MKSLLEKIGILRIYKATGYSLAGLRASYHHEAAFRQELVLFLILLPVITLLPVSLTYKMVLLCVNTLVLIVELINSAVESVVDMTSPGYHELAKRAKDMASAAVFLSLVLTAAVWLSAGLVSFGILNS
ncbi:MAG: diacylglycerol kinase [Desulfobulbaceae bacterium]|nr:MAG: diacylglycerol kinase [Desulfobulbaceae bacterium]